jgi:predicted ribosome quality control (RQC) complex YloA/Tae2 family protein
MFFKLPSTPIDLIYRQKYQKIRKRDAAVYDMEDASNNTPHSSAKTTTPRSNKRKGKHIENEMDDDEEPMETPTKKKAKAEKAKKAKKGSSEYAESEGTPIKLNGGEEDDFEVKSEEDIET